MEYVKRACQFYMEDETKLIKSKCVKMKSFRSEIIEPNGFTKASSFS